MLRCLASCSRIVVAPRTSGSTAGTLDGGGSGGRPSSRSITNAPRGTGEVVVPLAVIFRIDACVIKPPRMHSGRQRHAANPRAAHALDAVMGGELLVQHREVRADEVRGIEVVIEQLAEVGARLGDHRFLQIRAEFRVKLPVRIVRRDGAQLEPLAEKVLDEPLRALILEQAFDFRVQRLWLVQPGRSPPAS